MSVSDELMVSTIMIYSREHSHVVELSFEHRAEAERVFDWLESIASGIETEGHDPAEGHGAEHESPTAEGGDAQ
jgi:hypothetical protein